MKIATRRMVLTIAVILSTATIGLAQSLPAPTGDPILRVSGDVPVSNDGKDAAFDLAMLTSLPQTSFTTTTVWTEGETEFTGVLLKDFLDTLGVSAGSLSMIAVNDYAAEVPVSDAVVGGPILAYLVNGKEISVRDKGPLWLVYPYDSNPDYRTEVVYSRSIWQLARIEILP